MGEPRIDYRNLEEGRVVAHVVAGNGEVQLATERYDNRANAERGIAEIARTVMHLVAEGKIDLEPGDVNEEAEALKREADRLTKIQQAERGTKPGPVVDGKKTKAMGDYEATPEREQRAAEIVRLRRRSARLEHPL